MAVIKAYSECVKCSVQRQMVHYFSHSLSSSKKVQPFIVLINTFLSRQRVEIYTEIIQVKGV